MRSAARIDGSLRRRRLIGDLGWAVVAALVIAPAAGEASAACVDAPGPETIMILMFEVEDLAN